MARKITKLCNNIVKKVVFTAECSVVSACTGEHEFDGPTVRDVARQMIREGWLDDFIIEDTINLACPACVQYCKENVKDFDEVDVRVGGTAK